MLVNTDCYYYKGDKPCSYHKEHFVVCRGCKYYKKISQRILIIKLGALGDVIRTTPLLRELRYHNPSAEITWLTYYPEVLSPNYVDNILAVNIENITWLMSNRFGRVINLDKDKLALALASQIKAKKKTGFILDKFGKCKSVKGKAAHHKWLAGIDDGLSRNNKKNYLEEIFSICSFKFTGQEYILDNYKESTEEWDIDHSKKIIGLNTGASLLWAARLWPKNHWRELASRLMSDDYEVIILGGQAEDSKNKEIAASSGAKYFGHFPFKKFMNLVDECQTVVTCVTTGLHVAIGLKKKVVILNGTFNSNEFYLYDRGIILEPGIGCECYYSQRCPNDCMSHLSVDTVFNAILKVV